MSSLRDAKVDTLSTRNQDMRGRRVVGAAASVGKTDYVIQDELTKAIASVNQVDPTPALIDNGETVISQEPLLVKGDVDLKGSFTYRINGIDIVQPSVAPFYVTATGQAITTAYVAVTGLTFTLTKVGLWVITLDANVIQAVLDSFINLQLLVGGVPQVPSVQLDIRLTTGAIQNASKTWFFTSLTGAEVITVQIQKTAGTGASSITNLSTLLGWFRG